MAQKTSTAKPRVRTYARNRHSVSRKGYENVFEPDGVYLLKLVLVTLCGLFWIRLSAPIVLGGIVPVGAFPVGTLLGLGLIAWRERAQFNRKILYAVLVVITIIGFFLNAGIVI